jgi:hypothetical protein
MQSVIKGPLQVKHDEWQLSHFLDVLLATNPSEQFYTQPTVV